MPFLQDTEIQRWYAERKKKYQQMYQEDDDIFQGNGGQYANGTRLYSTPRNIIIKGSRMAADFMGDLEPMYIVEFEGDPLKETSELTVEAAHESYKTVEEMERVFKDLASDKFNFAPIERSRKVLFLELDDWRVDKIYNKTEWPSEVAVEKLLERGSIKAFVPLANDPSSRSFHEFEAVVIGDEDLDLDFLSLAKPLRDYFLSGGTVIVLACMGVYRIPQELSRAFKVKWDFAGCSKYTYRFTEAGKQIFADFDTKDVEYSKSNLLRVTPDEEAVLLPYYEEDESDDDNTPPKCTPVAVHTKECEGGTGRVAYFGGINFLEDYYPMIRSFIIHNVCRL